MFYSLPKKTWYIFIEIHVKTLSRPATTWRNSWKLCYIIKSCTTEIGEYWCYTEFALNLQNWSENAFFLSFTCVFSLASTLCIICRCYPGHKKSSTTAQYSLLSTGSCSLSCSGFYLKHRHFEVLFKKYVNNDLQFLFLTPYLPFTLTISKTHSHGQQVLIASKSWQRLCLASGLGCANRCNIKI